MEYQNTNNNYYSSEESNYCLDCGVDMGPMNPRQLCGKWYCLNAAFLDNADETANNNDDAKYNEEPKTKKAKQNDE